MGILIIIIGASAVGCAPDSSFPCPPQASRLYTVVVDVEDAHRAVLYDDPANNQAQTTSSQPQAHYIIEYEYYPLALE